MDVPPGAEGADVAQCHAVPCLWQMGGKGKTVEACGTDAEQPFRDDTPIESAFGRQVALVAFRPGFDGIGYVVTQQTGGGIAVRVIGGFLCLAGRIDTTQGIECGAVPEGLVTGLGQEAVFGSQAGREQGVDGACRTFGDALN